jgi:hypothetical protein
VAWNPMIPVARFGKQWSRARRMHDFATNQDAIAGGSLAAGASIWEEFVSLGASSETWTMPDPSAPGEFAVLGVNSSSGGTWTTSASNSIFKSGVWVPSLTFLGGGSYALLVSIQYLGTFRWVIVSSSGV